MKIAGFGFSKISIEKISNPSPGLRINNNLEISEIREVNPSEIKSRDSFLGVEFTFSLNYEPNVAKLEFVGEIVISVESKLAKDVLNQWKDKKLPEDFRINLLNIIFRKSSLKALHFEDEIGIPPHINFPYLSSQENQDNTQKS